MLSTSVSPFAELEIPGSIIFTMPTASAKKIPDMTAVADLWKTIMDTFKWFVGYSFPREIRYVLDVDIGIDGELTSKLEIKFHVIDKC